LSAYVFLCTRLWAVDLLLNQLPIFCSVGNIVPKTGTKKKPETVC
jgi:hypothetical protein